MGLNTPRPSGDFEERVFQHRDGPDRASSACFADGATMIGYGASTKGNVLLQFCGFGPEGHRARSRRSIPTSSAASRQAPAFRSCPKSEVPRSEPDYLLVFPWHFRDGIIAARDEYLRGGGRLIFPLPEIEIVGA